MLGHSVLCLLLLRHVPQTVVGDDSLDGIVLLFLVLPYLWVYAGASDLFISGELVDGEANVWCRVLAWRGGLRVWLHGWYAESLLGNG